MRLGLLPPNVVRVVTHLDVTDEDVEQALAGLRSELVPRSADRSQPHRAAPRSDSR